jgi:hypothetical protein
LRECFEHAVQALRVDPDAGIADLDAQQSAGLALAHCARVNHDRSVTRELDGVRHEVRDDLAQPAVVSACAAGYFARDLQFELDALRLGLQAGRDARLFERFVECEVSDVEFQPTGFDLRDVEDVVDDRHHLLA